MTPAARHAAAIDVLDLWLAGTALERALTNWARKNRYAGSGDRLAVRNIVFDVARRRRSTAAAGGAETGRAMVIGLLQQAGIDPTTLFTGQQYAPAALQPGEWPIDVGALPDPVRLDFPDWLEGRLVASLGPDFEAVMQALQFRAPTFLRVNAKKGDRMSAIRMLAADGITARVCDLANNALEVTDNERKIATSKAYLYGLVELQDAASQAVIEQLDLPEKGRILDYCSGGGGKALAMAAKTSAEIFAHDIDPDRMRNLPQRTERAGVTIRPLASSELVASGPFDLVLVDAPCSGSGAWRRSPGGKWGFQPDDLAALLQTQTQILEQAAGLVSANGRLGYVTCSILNEENTDQISGFLAANHGFQLELQRQFTSLDGGDGMFVASVKR
ncbi:MAG: RsmB/NOP family class I SAM-dependent RNA methyltransferase [Rhodobacteraceae bacterium]|nr:RsmB/NOP family class I SAM-dependent RNA methyltransferase [Paracoccaceae bacterium]